jgi:hypothetical protein
MLRQLELYRGGSEGITVTGFEEKKYVVTGYQAFGSRNLDGGHAVTTMRLRLDIQQDEGPPGRPATLAKIEFGADAANQIGQILRRPPPHAGEFELDVTLPAAEFDQYWNILTFTGRTHLSCQVALHPGDDIKTFEIASPTHIEADTH